ncbi:response regulator transcription factor [Paraburkholderia tropica]|uniref:response regulator transcription factor n=1 Tax=Paraburkholderia tropica TaxID=92647 RepID=UPI003D2823E0
MNTYPNIESEQPPEAIVYVIDDDQSIRTGLSNLLRSAGFSVRTFERTDEFLAFDKRDVPSCLLLDVRLRGESGLAFQQSACNQQFHMPIIILTGHGDVEMSVQAMKAGAVDFIAKPAKDQRIIDAVVSALATDSSRRSEHHTQMVLRDYFESLTRREREVVLHVVEGLSNKQIAARLHLSEITIKIHRSAAMRKMESGSIAELVRKIEALGALPGLRVDRRTDNAHLRLAESIRA